MGVISTNELFDSYFARKEAEGVDVRRLRGMVDRKEVFEYEKKIGKDLIDMNAVELLDMVKTFNADYFGTEFLMSPSTYAAISLQYRQIFDFYHRNYKMILNPWMEPITKGRKAIVYLAMHTQPYTFEMVQDIVRKVYNDVSSTERAQYIECMILLHHEGVRDADEIIGLKNKDVDIRTGTIRLPVNRTVTLSQRALELLYTVHRMTKLESRFLMVPWHDGYYRYSVRKKDADTFDDWTREAVAAKLTHDFSRFIQQPYGLKMNAVTLYLLGFYDFLVSRFGQEGADSMILSEKDAEAYERIEFAAREYGVSMYSNATKIKQALFLYVKSRGMFAQ